MAGAPCKVCTNEHKMDIEDALLQGISERNIAVRYQVPYGSVRNHKMDHMPSDMLAAYKAQRRLTEVMDVPDKMHHEWETLEVLLTHILEPFTRLRPQEALAMIDPGLLVPILRLRHKYFVTMLQVLGEMPEQTVVNVMMGSQWRTMLQRLDEGIGDDEGMRARFAQILAPDMADVIQGEYRPLPPSPNGLESKGPLPFEREEEDESGDKHSRGDD